MDTAAYDPLVGRLLDGRYLVGDKIARGGMATVYEATDLRLDRLVAVKVMPQALADDEAFSQRFVREARAAARLTHPNVVAVYDQGEDDGILFLAMEYVAGRHTLRDVIRNEAPLTPSRALAILEHILKAIAAAHEAGIVHRDIKPENVLIDPRGEIKVADFGLARAISAATAATATGGVLMGTVSYLPPELVIDGSADARSDVYVLGVLLYELLTGTKPHVGDSPIQVAYKHVHEDVGAPSSVVEGIPPYLDAFVARATSRERDLRPADAHVMLQQLRRVRHALDHGVLDDEELTDDLTPTLALRLDRADRTDRAAAGAVPASHPGPAFVTAAESDWTVAVDEADASSADQRPSTGASASGSHPRRRWSGWVALLIVLLLATVAAYAGWWYGVGRFRPTPDVIQLSQRAAQAKIERAGLSFQIAQTAYSEKVDQGAVISTDPGAGDRVLADGTVRAVVSKGPERHLMPNLDGLSEKAALAKVEASSLRVAANKARFSAEVARGKVISFTPAAGKELRRDSPVEMVVSKGPEPIQLSDYTGRSADTASDELTALDLDVVRRQKYDDDVAAGLVIKQQPNQGSRFAGDRILLLVSRGPHLVEVPDVDRFGIQDAEDALTAAGFTVETEQVQPYFGLGFVVGQSPGASEFAPYGTTVTLQIV